MRASSEKHKQIFIRYHLCFIYGQCIYMAVTDSFLCVLLAWSQLVSDSEVVEIYRILAFIW